tara:strand:- start:2725 stop:6795 length:4071 start_codon:yes stop_codon:yes gene_type:complete
MDLLFGQNGNMNDVDAIHDHIQETISLAVHAAAESSCGCQISVSIKHIYRSSLNQIGIKFSVVFVSLDGTTSITNSQGEGWLQLLDTTTIFSSLLFRQRILTLTSSRIVCEAGGNVVLTVPDTLTSHRCTRRGTFLRLFGPNLSVLSMSNEVRQVIMQTIILRYIASFPSQYVVTGQPRVTATITNVNSPMDNCVKISISLTVIVDSSDFDYTSLVSTMELVQMQTLARSIGTLLESAQLGAYWHSHETVSILPEMVYISGSMSNAFGCSCGMLTVEINVMICVDAQGVSSNDEKFHEAFLSTTAAQLNVAANDITITKSEIGCGGSFTTQHNAGGVTIFFTVARPVKETTFDLDATFVTGFSQLVVEKFTAQSFIVGLEANIVNVGLSGVVVNEIAHSINIATLNAATGGWSWSSYTNENGINTGVRTIQLSAASEFVAVGMMIQHPNIWLGSTITHINTGGTVITVSQPTMTAHTTGYIPSLVGSQIVMFATTLTYYSVNLLPGSWTVVLAGDENMHVRVGMICAHSNIYPGTLVTGINSGNILTLSHPTRWSHDGDYTAGGVSRPQLLTFTSNAVLEYMTTSIGIEAGARNLILSSPNAYVSTGMRVTHRNIWAGTFVHSIIGSTIVLSHPCKKMGDVGFIFARGKQTLQFTPSLLTFNTDANGIVADRLKITIGTPSSQYGNRWPGYIMAGMGIVHASVLPGTTVSSVDINVVALSQKTTQSVEGVQKMQFTPLTVTTNSDGIGSGVTSITMSTPSAHIKVGMLVVHANVLPGTTVASLSLSQSVLSLSLSQRVLSIGDAFYKESTGIQTVQFKPLTFITNYIGIRASTNSITMSISNQAIVVGMIVLHPCLVPGTTVKSFEGTTLVLTKLSLSNEDIRYFNGSGIQTLTFSHADDSGNGGGDDNKKGDSEADVKHATPSSSTTANTTENPLTPADWMDWTDDEFIMIIVVLSSGGLLLICFFIFIACYCKCCGCCTTAAAGAGLPSKIIFAVSHLQANEIQKDVLSSSDLLSSYIKELNADVVLFSADNWFDLKMQKKSEGYLTVFCEAAQQTNTCIVMVSLQRVLVIDSSGKCVTQTSPTEVSFNVHDVPCHAFCVLDNKNFKEQVWQTNSSKDVKCLFVLDPGNLPELELQTISKEFQMYIVSVQMKNLLAPERVKSWDTSQGASSNIFDSNGKIQGKTSKNGKFARFTAFAGKISRSSSASDGKVSPDGKVVAGMDKKEDEEILHENIADTRAKRRRSRSAGASGVMVVPLNLNDEVDIEKEQKKKKKNEKKSKKKNVKVVPATQAQNTPGSTIEEEGTKTKTKQGENVEEVKIAQVKKTATEKARREKSLARRKSRINIDRESMVHL